MDSDLFFILFWVGWFLHVNGVQGLFDLFSLFVLFLGIFVFIIKSFFIQDLFISVIKMIWKYIPRRRY
jgi:hypothetical protein